MSNKLWSFHRDYGRMGYVEGLFVATDEEIDSAIGKFFYFGKILGKHSEVYGYLAKEDLTLVTDNQEVISILLAAVSNPISGYNPLDYV